MRRFWIALEFCSNDSKKFHEEFFDFRPKCRRRESTTDSSYPIGLDILEVFASVRLSNMHFAFFSRNFAAFHQNFCRTKKMKQNSLKNFGVKTD